LSAAVGVAESEKDDVADDDVLAKVAAVAADAAVVVPAEATAVRHQLSHCSKVESAAIPELQAIAACAGGGPGDGGGGVGGDGGGVGDASVDFGGEGGALRCPQSVQSVPGRHRAYSEPGPPSSQAPSARAEHVSVQLEVAGGEGGGEASKAVDEHMERHIRPSVASSEVGGDSQYPVPADVS